MGYSSSFGDGEKIKQIHQQKALPKSNLEGLFYESEYSVVSGESVG
jgi:hypothetical protein